MEVLELDLSSRWPERIRETVASVASEYPECLALDSSESYRIPDAIRWRILDSVADTPIVIYHATKLLEHEIEAVSSSGLQAVSKEMLTHRIQQALAHNYISNEFAGYLLDYGLSSAGDSNREGKISVFTSRLALRRESNFWRQFTFWGGEALRDELEQEPEVMKSLKSIGEPCIVRGFVVLGSLDDDDRDSFDLPFNLFKMLGGGPAEDQLGGVFSVLSLPAENILGIITEHLDPSEWTDIAPMSE